VCHAGVGKAWESIIYRMIEGGQCSRPSTTDRLKKRRYSGGLVLEPEPKSYAIPIEVIDVKGLYPTVMMLHNLSFETICCSCCRDNPAARVPQEIMDSINEGLRNKIKSKKVYESEKRSERCWICLKNRGAIPMMLAKFKQERDHYRALVDEPMSQALKVMMNSIYGLFGSDGIFEFQDYRVAELVTTFARVKLIEMKEIASKQFGMNIIYGDTDSIFVSDMNEERRHELVHSFIAICKQTLGVEVDHQNTFVKSILIGKKHYIGIQPDGKVVVKGMEGKKRDRPPFFNQVFSELIEDYRNNKPDLRLNVLEAFKQLEAAEVDPSLLAYSVVLNKDPDQYRSYTPQHKIGTSMNKEDGSLIKYYKTGLEEDGYKGYSTNYQDLNVDVYKEELWKLVKEILMLQGYDIQKLEDEIFGEEVEVKQYTTVVLDLWKDNRQNIRDHNQMINKMNHWLNTFYHYELSTHLNITIKLALMIRGNEYSVNPAK
jgi:DNA polymerase, archaea type